MAIFVRTRAKDEIASRFETIGGVRHMATNRSAWHFEEYALAWTHAAGLTVYVDPTPTLSGAIRCVGPFSAGQTDVGHSRVLSLMEELTTKIEVEMLEEHQYVVWGTFRLCDPIEAHRLPLLGADHYFTPNIALRSQLLDLSASWDLGASVDREWVVCAHNNLATHKSGFVFSLPRIRTALISIVQVDRSSSPFDASLFHSATMREMLTHLSSRACRLLGFKSLINSTKLVPQVDELWQYLRIHTEFDARLTSRE